MCVSVCACAYVQVSTLFLISPLHISVIKILIFFIFFIAPLLHPPLPHLSLHSPILPPLYTVCNSPASFVSSFPSHFTFFVPAACTASHIAHFYNASRDYRNIVSENYPQAYPTHGTHSWEWSAEDGYWGMFFLDFDLTCGQNPDQRDQLVIIDLTKSAQ